MFVSFPIWVKDLVVMNNHCELSALGMEQHTELSVCLPETLNQLASKTQCHVKAEGRRGAEGRPTQMSAEHR